MKKLFNQKLSLLVFGFLILTACGDDDVVKTKGQFTLGEETTKVASGHFIYDTTPNSDSEGTDYYRNQLVLLGSGLKVNSTGDGVTGEGNMLELYINNAGQQLQTGTYAWEAEENEQPFDLWLGFITVGLNTDNEAYYTINTGEVTVSKSGSKYKISFTGTAYLQVDGGDEFKQNAGLPLITVTATFEGKLGRHGFDF